MKDWLAAQPSDRVFIEAGDGVHTYGEIARLVSDRPASGVEVVRPTLSVASIVDLLAIMSSGTAVVTGPDQTPPSAGSVPDDTVCVIFTSGTTGTPKGVRLTRKNWEAAARSSMEHLGHDHTDTWLLAVPLHHVAGLGIVLRSLFAGGRIRLSERFDPAGFAADLSSGVTMASVVPRMLRRTLDASSGPYAGLKAVLVGGGPIPDGLLERAGSAGIPVLPTYGMTETCGQVATLRPGSTLEKKAHPLPGVRVRIGAGGVIELQAPMLSPGYVGEVDRMPHEWFVTGDVGEIDDDGALRILGRTDDMIITGGENVDPVEVERVLESYPGLGGALVVGVPSPEWGQEVACLYEGDIEVLDLEAWLRSRLPSYAVPRRWRQVEAIPRVGPGKPDRTAARSMF